MKWAIKFLLSILFRDDAGFYDLRREILNKAIEKDIENKLGKMKLEINKNLIDLYLWRGGVNGASVYDGTFEYFFSFGSFIDIGSAFSLLLLDRKTLKIYDKKLPFIQSLTGDTVSIDLSSKSSTRGMLLLFSPSLTLSSENTFNLNSSW